MPKVMVLVRHLPGANPVAFKVIEESKDPGVDDQEHYMNSVADDEIIDLKHHVPEFRDADFYRYILDL